MESPSLRSSYLPHINGLRALAILGVLIYHLRAEYCPAGYFGVDLFLVISGFLLFRSLLKPGVEQNFHYGSYLLKKAWRIIPSWFIVTLVVLGLSLYLFAPIRLVDIIKTARYSAIFQADYYIDRSGDYFNIFSQQNPLLHYWYLSITQQLYLVAPLLVIPFTRWCSRRAAIILLTVLSLLSLAYYIFTTETQLLSDPVRDALLHSLGTKTSYYHLIPRFWEIAAGFAVFLLPEFANWPKLRGVLGLAGLAGIISSFYLYATGSPAVYLTVVSSLLTIRYASTGLAAWLLARQSVQALGTISFSLYLWHWPIMVFWKYCCMDAPGLWDEVGMIVLSLLLGTLSWWAIERIKTPSRADWKGTLQRCSLLLTLPVILVSATQLNKQVRDQGREDRMNRLLSHTATAEPETDAEVLRGLEDFPKLGLSNPILRVGTADAAPSFILTGDSHAWQLYDGIHAHARARGVRGVYFNNSISPFWNLKQSKNARWNQEIAGLILDYLKTHESIRYIIIAEYWEYRLASLYHDDLPVTPELMRSVPKSDNTGYDWRTGKPLITPEERLAVTEPGLGELCDKIRELGREVILLGDNPIFANPSPRDEWERCHQFKVPYKSRHVTVEEHEARHAISHRILKQLAAEGRAHYVDMAPAMLVDGAYPDMVGETFLYQDCDHMSVDGARRAVDYIMPQLLDIMQVGSNEPSTTESPAAASGE